MSTKLYSGRKLKNNLELQELNSLCKALRTEIKQIKETFLFNYLIEKAVLSVDEIRHEMYEDVLQNKNLTKRERNPTQVMSGWAELT